MKTEIMRKYVVLSILILHTAFVAGQYLANPSFEGPPGIAITPPDWLPFDPASTPDTEPLDCDNFPASHGETYVTLVARGTDSQENPNTVENCQAQLLEYLQAGTCYTLSMDLASRDNLGHYIFGDGFKYYTSTVSLKVYGSNSSGEKGELLFQTDPVLNTNWESSSFSINSTVNINFLLFEVNLTTAASANGNLLIDNLVIDQQQVSRVMLNETYHTSDLPISLEATESSSYGWLPGSGLSCYDCRSPEVNSNISTTYTCSIVSPTTGCPENELFILNFVEDPLSPTEFKIPNVFTPNGDGVNDNFEITGLPPYSSLIIYNRSGKEVFSSETYHSEWDGTDMDNNPLPSGTYWYVLITPGLSGKHKGSIYLKRD